MIDKIANPAVAPVREVPRAERLQTTTQRVPADTGPTTFPATPPPEVLAALDEGARVMREISDSRMELSFEIVQEEAGKRVRIQVRESNGDVVRDIPARKLLDMLAGESRGLAVDALG